MAEPTVPVPVSLIERILGNRTTDTLAELRALLSQPTRTALDLAAQTEVVRAVDAEYMDEGGSTRHWVQALNRAGYVIAPDPPTIRDVREPGHPTLQDADTFTKIRAAHTEYHNTGDLHELARALNMLLGT